MNPQKTLPQSQQSQRAEDRQHELDTLLFHIAVSCPYDAEELSRRIARPKSMIHEDLTAMMADGDVHFHDAALRASAASRIIASARPEQLREVHDQILAEIESGVGTRPATLIALAESGCVDPALLRELIQIVGDHPDDAAAIGALTTVARARDCGEQELRILSATDAAKRGHTNQVLSITDGLLISKSPEVFAQAGILAASALIQSNRLERSLAIYRRIPPERIGFDAAWAIVAAIGNGDHELASHWREVLGNETLTSYEAGLVDLADGVLKSASGNGEGALEALARSASALAPLGADILLPESPAAMAAFVAIGKGDPATAETLLERALSANLGGESSKVRHLLLSGWAAMLQGKMDAAEEFVAKVAKNEHLGDRDRLFYLSLLAGIARRRTDLKGMRDALQEIRGHTFGMSFTLFDLLPLGEILVVAARLQELPRARDLVTRVQSIAAKLHDPVAWTAPFHWSAVQAAFQANDPAALIPHANALGAAQQTSSYAATLARAGQTWLEVLRRKADFASVEASANALASHGQVWDAARLAGQAALQQPQREGALSLMQLARDINKLHAADGSHAPLKNATLTRRELEVAQLVLDGQGYRAIGEQLFISPKTVEHHVARMRNRLGAESRSELLQRLQEIISELD
ncbi:MAG: LuxR C-terminal-related transcriptional regulator [Gulosibacter sp.]|uniref:LuxR C-terminal-related transcriptional regulator n=1 Tax=Gulosibacter sp. TaxID=2817531 RepID=UPI003F8F02B6